MKERKIWLVWSMLENRAGNPALSIRAVDESAEKAETHKKMIHNEHPEAKVWIEKRVSNHLYGHRDMIASGILAR